MAKSSKKKQHGKKSSKHSTKKKNLQTQLQTTIDEAYAKQNPLDFLPPAFLSVALSKKDDADNNSQQNNESTNSDDDDGTSKENSIATIQHYTSPLPPPILQQCLDLFKMNMGDMYQHSKWGLDMDEKLKELSHSKARFLVVTSTVISEAAGVTVAGSNDERNEGNIEMNDNAIKSVNDTSCNNPEQHKVLGFAHFRYELDEDENAQPTLPITYLYELQIHPTIQKVGLGKKLMTIIELLSFQLKMKKVMLTVFHVNTGAMGFYEKRRYAVDECSPSNYEGVENENCDYEIMSKEF